MKALVCRLILLASLTPVPLVAHDVAPVSDRVALSASASREITTDSVTVVLYKEHQAADQATAADEVNRAIGWGMSQIEGAGLRGRTTTYRSYPIYRKDVLIGWRVLQRLQVQTDDAGALAKLLGTLQTRLSVQSLQHVLSPAARAEAEESLMSEALATFQRRADLIARSLGRSGHRIVSISVNTSDVGRPVPMARTASVAASAKVTSPIIEGGEQRVEVTVSGSVELEPAP